jgi:hypothetical protein
LGELFRKFRRKLLAKLFDGLAGSWWEALLMGSIVRVGGKTAQTCQKGRQSRVHVGVLCRRERSQS